MTQGVADIVRADHVGSFDIVHVPALVRGQLVWPPRVTPREIAAVSADPTATSEHFHLVRHDEVTRDTHESTGRLQLLVFPVVDPRRLVEHDATHLAACLHRLPFAEVLAAFDALRELLAPDGEIISALWPLLRQSLRVDDRLLGLFLAVFPALLDGAGIGAAVDEELGALGRPGRELLDGWVPYHGTTHVGRTERLARRFYGFDLDDDGSPTGRPATALSARPLRQLHITAGNAPVIPIVSLIRALATKGAAVVKTAAGTALFASALAQALHELGAEHPLVHHTSILYWPGGHRLLEDELFRPESFDRIVVWGGAETVASVRSRAVVPVIAFEPRVSVSLIGREAFDGDLGRVAVRAAVDSLVENQAACTSSLVHYVEGDEPMVLRYCETLRDVLAEWDQHVPHRPSREVASMLRRARRTDLVRGTWFVNASNGAITSAVVYSPHPIDLSAHPQSRCVVVRRVDDLADVVHLLHRGVSAVGVHPRDRWLLLRDSIAACGVTTVVPLGTTERGWAGMPHDGTRVLSQLVNWTMS